MRKSLASFDKVMDKKYKNLVGQISRKASELEMYKVIPTDSPGLNYVLGNGGICLGKLYLFKGEKSSGKSALAYHVAGCVQRNIALAGKLDSDGDLITKGNILLVDAEFSFNKKWVEKLSIDTNEECFRVGTTETGEQGLELVEHAVESGLYDGIIVDSINALVPEAMVENDMGDATMGARARMMAKAFSRLLFKMDKYECPVFFISQITGTMNKYKPEALGGGKASEFYPHIILHINSKSSERLKEKESVVGLHSKVVAQKNKLSAPFRETEIDLYFKSGFNFDSEYIDCAIDTEVIKRAGAWYTVTGQEETIQGKDAVIEYYDNNPELFEDLKKLVYNATLVKDFAERGIDISKDLAEKEEKKAKPKKKKTDNKSTE